MDVNKTTKKPKIKWTNLNQLYRQINNVPAGVVFERPRHKDTLPRYVGALVGGGFGHDRPLGTAQAAYGLWGFLTGRGLRENEGAGQTKDNFIE